MYAVEVKDVSKTYGSRKVVDGVSFEVATGEILGLIGPNGAGKTTNIRMIMDIIKPDSGQVLIFGERFCEEFKSRFGYLPEERGLYRKRPIVESVTYLATLKGMNASEATRRADQLLERVKLQPHRNKRIEELSHGMSQLVQFIVTIVHDPQVIILDEPFTGLDPVNVKMVKDMILEFKGRGKAIMLSTHRMNEVEELCDRVFMINRGQNVLYGNLREIKAGFRSNAVLVDYEGRLPALRDVNARQIDGHTAELKLEDGTTPQDVLRQLVEQGTTVNRFEVATPSLNDIFIRLAGSAADETNAPANVGR